MTLPTLVNSAFLGPSGSFTLPWTPTPGNLLILYRGYDGNAGAPAGQPGFTPVIQVYNGPNGVSTRYGDLSSRVVQPGGAAPDNGFIQDFSSGHTTWFVWEYQVAQIDSYVGVTNIGGGWNAPGPSHHQAAGGALTPTSGKDVEIIAIAGVRIGPGEDLVHTSTPDSGWTQDYFIADLNNNFPDSIIMHKDVTGTSGSYTGGGNMTLTGSANGISYYGITFTVRTATLAPVCSFTATPLSGFVPLSVTFTDTSTNTPTSWLWDFGDGYTSTLQNPTHLYAHEGVYDVSLTATNDGGSCSTTVHSYITVSAFTTTVAKPVRVSIDKSLNLDSDTAEVELENEDLPLNWGPDTPFLTNTVVRIWQWYGDD